ncbi:hypothetical protein [Leptospira noguchii]|uniref:Uncharacterized protein n=1 Tax=Leptospira noguchii serovar Panama str. CZ214 TaxID=1001595 RepID=T0FTK2_9LEPT|nr:hypothetical protein [Leptospira noguchii]EQA72880.1 hypothetical protein LEP1GSC059_3322 [Leptospira noguchii serovar Panama str. CZ214]
MKEKITLFIYLAIDQDPKNEIVTTNIGKGYVIQKTKEGDLVSERNGGEMTTGDVQSYISSLKIPNGISIPRFRLGYGRLRLLRNVSYTNFSFIKYYFLSLLSWTHRKNISVFKRYNRDKLIREFYLKMQGGMKNLRSYYLFTFIFKSLFFRFLFIAECIVIPVFSIVFLVFIKLYNSYLKFILAKANLYDQKLYNHVAKISNNSGRHFKEKALKYEGYSKDLQNEYIRMENEWHSNSNALLNISLAIIAILASYYVGTYQTKEDIEIKKKVEELKIEVEFLRQRMTP